MTAQLIAHTNDIEMEIGTHPWNNFAIGHIRNFAVHGHVSCRDFLRSADAEGTCFR